MGKARQDGKRRLILDAARSLIVERGFPNVVLDDVARAAGVAKGTLFLYFRDKEELLGAAFADLIDRLGELLDGLPPGLAGRALIEETARTVLAHFDANRDFVAQFCTRLPASGSPLLGRMAANFERLRRIFKKAGLAADEEFAAAAFMGLCRSAFMLKLIGGGRGRLADRARSVTAFFLDGAGRLR